MIDLKPLTIGPILGYVTDRSARIFGRGEYVPSPHILPVNLGVQSYQLFESSWGAARFREKGSSEFNLPQFFKLNPNADMSGVVTFENLKPDTHYEYEIGWFIGETEPEIGVSINWSGAIKQHFKSGTNNGQEPRSFVYGACRYMQRLAPGIWRYGEDGDKTFGTILKQIEDGLAIDALLMVGDQIYADDNFTEVTDQDLTVERYFDRYRNTFGQPAIRQLMGQVPTYMTLDDHEILDNWPKDAGDRQWTLIYPAAIQAYETYQLSHSPLFASPDIDEEERHTGEWGYCRLWYQFQDGCCDFFALDCRTERELGDTPETRAMLGSRQMEALKKWLCDGSGRIKFVITSVPFFPDKLSGGGLDQDKWGGFLKQRTELLDLIFERDLKRVVFLAGDVACGMSAEVYCPEKPDFKVVSVISSGLFWPFTHRAAKHFQMNGKLATLSSHQYELVHCGPVVSIDHFTRINANLDGLIVEMFSSTGRPCGRKIHEF
ncbi:alkaline phosphatase [Rippkaea orientalis PCC 8801]|uniref:Alkaline phosphatase n=1 Tax=Rippkaea orientalis (strain PCC 8801 / RF-1) TaxID=41431 RepID=B7JZL9_RIPO1|nr:alkaline phosphatase D family protein [Rippkaea orientalis]ACK64962.1 alkaline phosphatase [Rippkaea orientalis PCC 8801]